MKLCNQQAKNDSKSIRKDSKEFMKGDKLIYRGFI